MYSTNYYLLPDQERDIIVHEESGVQINVFGLEVDQFVPTKGEIHIFGEDHGEWLAFETINYDYNDLDIVKAAVTWYARYLDYPEMQIITEDPRPDYRLRIDRD
jgi:hypothetical protein